MREYFTFLESEIQTAMSILNGDVDFRGFLGEDQPEIIRVSAETMKEMKRRDNNIKRLKRLLKNANRGATRLYDKLNTKVEK